MLRIGDFSSLAQVSIKTLCYYDRMELLMPARVDAETGYRYYSAAQISRLHRILVLKDLGFSLDQISALLESNLPAEQMRGMLLLRQAEQQKRVEEEQDRLNRLTSRIRLIEQENKMAADVMIKSVNRQWIASVRETIPAYNQVGRLYPKVMQALGPAMANTTVPVALWHDPEFKEADVDAEAGFYLQKPIAATAGIDVHELPEISAASTIHQGSYQRLPEAYDALLRWVTGNGYRLNGPIREVYLRCTAPVRQDDESYITELQAPVAKL